MLTPHIDLSFPVLGGVESRGVLRKISDMLEVIMKRMDSLSRLGNTSDAHRLDELSSALDRYSVLLFSLSFLFFIFFPCLWAAPATCQPLFFSASFSPRHSYVASIVWLAFEVGGIQSATLEEKFSTGFKKVLFLPLGTFFQNCTLRGAIKVSVFGWWAAAAAFLRGRELLSSGVLAEKPAFFSPSKRCMNCLRRSQVS